MKKRGSFKNRIRSGQVVYGGWTSLGHPSIAEMLCAAGFDFIGIDMEHSTLSLAQAQRVITAAQATGTASLPRVSSHNGEQIRRLLDAGADGIIVPNVESASQVEKILSWCKYPPLGQRSFGVARAQGYGFRFDEYVRSWNNRSVLIPQIESVRGVEAAEEILCNPQVDGAMIGPYDISGSLGIPGQLEHPRVRKACEQILKVCRRLGKACGTQIVDPNPQRIKQAVSAGYHFVVLSSDIFLLWKWGEQVRRWIRR